MYESEEACHGRRLVRHRQEKTDERTIERHSGGVYAVPFRTRSKRTHQNIPIIIIISTHKAHADQCPLRVIERESVRDTHRRDILRVCE